MPIALGAKLGLLVNASIGENYVDVFRQTLQGYDQLIQMSVISVELTVPPSNPNNGDAYLLPASPSGLWAGNAGSIAVWDTQVTTSGTNTTIPQWVFYKPNPGWVTYVTTSGSLILYNGTTWSPIVAGAVQAEVPSGAINGSNVNYSISFIPYPIGSFQLYVNGIFQIPAVNYTLTTTALVMGVAPSSGSTLFAVYTYV